MDLTPSPEQARLQSVAREFGAERLRPRALERDKSAEFPTADLAEMAKLGLMGVNVAKSLGGQEAGVIAYSLAVTEIAAADPAVAVTMCVNNMVAEVLQAFGTDAQRERWVPPLVSGEFSSGSFCLSEAGAGSDPQGMRTRAVRGDGGWVLQGTKAWITSGAHAGVFVVWARTGEEISTFVVDPKTDGISCGKAEEKTGQHASNTVSVNFDDVHVPDDALLGDLGRGFPVAMMALDGGRVGIASQSLGIARAVLSELRASGVDPAELGPVDAEWNASRLLVLRAASMKERGELFSREASMAKLYASEQCGRACDAAFRLLGARAFRQPSFVDKLARDARVTRIYEGTSEIQRIVIARNLLRQAAAGGGA